MKIKDLLKKILRFCEAIAAVSGAASVLLSLIGSVQEVFSFSIPLFGFAKQNTFLFFVIGVAAYLFFLTSWLFRIHRRLTKGFRDRFKKPLNRSWDYQGDWSISDSNALRITNSHLGGITKVGANWENYSFSFKAKILRKCIGVIVRAVDLNNYYMFQIHSNAIVPHRLVAVPLMPKGNQGGKGDPDDSTTGDIAAVPISFLPGWQLFEAYKTNIEVSTEEWQDIRLECVGESVAIFINDKVVFQEESFLKNPRGKVGFRNHKEETALVRDVRVKLLS